MGSPVSSSACSSAVDDPKDDEVEIVDLVSTVDGPIDDDEVAIVNLKSPEDQVQQRLQDAEDRGKVIHIDVDPDPPVEEYFVSTHKNGNEIIWLNEVLPRNPYDRTDMRTWEEKSPAERAALMDLTEHQAILEEDPDAWLTLREQRERQLAFCRAVLQAQAEENV